ncbi:hypothetical protein [Tenacibaculum soleae]|uniref:hypothetical protein n=1 Tax=Tenacibaculum soleae TaxID=447689 RepID=UPI0023019BD9|nr:hypothetical protein [Tenacibaculum soleae]
MYQPSFGTDNPILFETQELYYETLGFLSKSDGTTAITWENNQNQGARSHEVRIQCYSNIANFPLPLTRKFTGGTGRSLHRINATAFLEDLLNNHNFIEGEIQDINAIRNSIPQQYIADFNRGLTL